MIISEIPVPNNTYVVMFITDKNNDENHIIYFLNENGDLITNGVKVWNAKIYEVTSLVKHMMKIHFTSDITETLPSIESVFSRLDDNDEVQYDDFFSWQLTKDVVGIIQRYCKLVHVLNYEYTTECCEEAHILNDWWKEGNSPKVLDIIQNSVI